MTGIKFGLIFTVCLVVQQQGVLTYFMRQNCGRSYPRPSPRIVNGQTAVLGMAPFMAYLYINSSFHCGGSIITERYILTAGHCVEKDLKVRLGEYNTRTNPDCDGTACFPSIEIYGIQKSILHAGYNDITLANDIALLKLNRRIIFNVNTQPVCLVRSPTYLPPIHEFHAFGWGRTENRTIARVLQTTKLYLYSNSFCNSRLNDSLNQNQFCAATRNSDTCQGDSGGPLVTHLPIGEMSFYVQLGLVSFGDSHCRGVGVYTYVPNYTNWIWKVIQSN